MIIINKHKSIKLNYIYNTLLTVLNLIFPLITFPYISRVLGSSGVGKVDFANSIIQYFILIGSLGIPIYGIREIAKVRDSVNKRSKVFSELFILGAITNCICIIILFFMINSIPKLIVEYKLFYILSINLIFNIFALDWLFQGLEEYKYITLRSIIVKVISIIFLFIFIRNKSQYVLYAFVSVIGISGSNLFNAISLRKYVKITLRNLDLKKHLKPVLIIFASLFATSIYVNLNTTMLGFLAGDAHVGYYSAVNKLNRMVIALVASLVIVLTPRISYYFNENLFEEINSIISLSIKFVIFIALPAVFAQIILSSDLIMFFSGKDFIPAIVTMKIISPIVLIVGLCNITNTLILIPMNREKYVLISVILGAISNVLINIILIPRFQENGAAIASLLAEFIVLISQIACSKQFLKGKIINKENFKYLASTIIMSIIIIVIKLFIRNSLVAIVLSLLLAGSAYIISLLLLKDEVAILLLKTLKLDKILFKPSIK